MCKSSKDYELSKIKNNEDGSSEVVVSYPDKEGVMIPTRRVIVSGFLQEIYKDRENNKGA